MSTESELLVRLEALEKRVAYLEGRPAQHVPSPLYGPRKDYLHLSDDELEYSNQLREDIQKNQHLY